MLYSKRIESLVRDSDDLATFKADITTHDSPAKAYFNELGERGIPLLIVDGPGVKAPLITGFYTTDDLINMVNQARGK